MDIYENVFKTIRDFVLRDDFEMQRLKLDFEHAEKEGVKKVFPNVELIGCEFHLSQALIRQAKKGGIYNESLEKETKEIFKNIHEILEDGSQIIDTYLESAQMLYSTQKAGSIERQVINEKYVSFIFYIKNTWMPRFHEGMLSYAQKEKKEWTNNAIERYHQRLQQKLPKNPSTQLFFNEIQQEESII